MSTTISGTNGVTFPDSTSMQTGQQACKAWVNFNGTGAVAIRGSYNVSSITDVGTGNYTVNFTTAMPDANYSANANATKGGGTQSESNSTGVFYREDRVLAGSLEIYTTTFNGSYADRNNVMVTIFSN